MLRAGFIGAGGRSQGAHYPNVARLPDVEMVAVCELDQERLDQVVGKYQFPHVFNDHRKMLETVELDIVYCVMHEKWIRQPALDCLLAGKDIFIEKPPGANSDETCELLETAVKNDRYAMVGYQRRYAAVVREAMRRVADKGGQVSLATTTFNKQILGENKEFTTTLWNDVTHVVDLLRFMVGSEPSEVAAYQDVIGGVVRNAYSAMVRFENESTGVVFGNRASGGRVLRAELHGVGVGCYMKLPEEIEIHQDNEMQVVKGWELEGQNASDTDRYEGVLSMHEHFVECVKNREIPCSDLRDVIHSIDLVDQIEGLNA